MKKHVYIKIKIPYLTLCTLHQFEKLHKKFFHPPTDKIFNLVRRAKPDKATPDIFDTLKKIAARSDPCQRMQNLPTSFRVCFPAEHVVFTIRVFLDIIYINNKTVLHVFDEAAHFIVARLLPGVSKKNVWNAFVK